MIALATDLGALAFWGFIAICVIAGVWQSIRRRDAQQRTLQAMIESGQDLDQDTKDAILSEDRDVSRDLRYSGLIVLFIAPGLALLGWFLKEQAPEALMPLLGVAVLVGFLGFGLLVAARAARR